MLTFYINGFFYDMNLFSGFISRYLRCKITFYEYKNFEINNIIYLCTHI